eukprot:scaffold576_cov180-Skeletonema_dohrnii-CCMP3373.AAC.5
MATETKKEHYTCRHQNENHAQKGKSTRSVCCQISNDLAVDVAPVAWSALCHRDVGFFVLLSFGRSDQF